MCSFSQGLKLWFVSKSMLHTHKHSFFYVKTGRGSFMQLGFMSVVHRRVRTCANGNSFGRSFSLSCCKIKERPASFWGFSSPEVWGKQNWLVFRLYLRHFNGVQFETLPDCGDTGVWSCCTGRAHLDAEKWGVKWIKFPFLHTVRIQLSCRCLMQTCGMFLLCRFSF